MSGTVGRRRASLTLSGAVLVVAGAVAAGALGASGDGVLDTTLVSRASGAAGAVGDSNSFESSISADGRYVAFHSNATNLDPDSDDGVTDVFVRDLETNTTTLVSRASGAAGAVGDFGSNDPSISADGRYVAFHSAAHNLDPDSDDGITDVFVRDLETNTTTLVSRASGAAGTVGDLDSDDPSISADGRYVAFDSDAINLDPDSDDTVPDVFVRDTQANITTLASRASGAAGDVGDGASVDAAISADGRYVAFESDADNLDDDSDDAFPHVFVRDLQASNDTTLVSRASGAAGDVGDDGSQEASISADGRHVAFRSAADNLDPDSDDDFLDVFVRDTQADITTLVSRADGAAGAVGDGGPSLDPSLSADGRHVAFQSYADNLDPDSDDGFPDIFVRDLVASTTSLASRATGAAGAAGDGLSGSPSTSADGGRVAFDSNADNLDPDSDDGVSDVFVRELVDPIDPVPTPTTRCAGVRATKVGTAGGDKLRGTPRRDVIAGLGGNDVIRGLGGKDILCGGKGRDRLLGGRGRDRLLGQRGNDILRGGPGRDKLLGGPGRDRLLGQGGNDILRGGPGRDKLLGGPGRDRQVQ
jgi:Tol biopolymer transport system component